MTTAIEARITDRFGKVAEHLNEHECEVLRYLLFSAGHKWGELTPDQIVAAFAVAGFKIMTDDAIQRLMRL